MVKIDIREWHSWLFVPTPPVLASFRVLDFNRGAAVRLDINIADIEFFVMNGLLFLICAFYGVKDDFGFDKI